VTRFDRYVLAQLLLLFGFFALVLVGIYWINRAVVLFEQLISDGQMAGTFLQVTLLTLPNVIRMVLPIAAFVASVYVINRLTVESELVVAQAAGMSPWRLARPVLVFGLIVSLMMGALVHVLVPKSRIALAERLTEARTDLAARLLTDGRFVHPTDGVTLYIREITPAGELRGVFLSDAREPGDRVDYTGRQGYFVTSGAGSDGPSLVLVDGSAQAYDEATARLSVTRFENFTYDLSELSGEGDGRDRDVREYPTQVLFAPTAAALEETGDAPGEFLYEGHLRIVQPFTPAIAALLGFAALQLGSYSRFGVWRQVGLAILLIVLVQIGENAVADIARRDPELWPLIYAPFLGALGVTLVILWIAASPGWRRRDGAGGRAPPAAALPGEAPR
jgi:lipopolysaccharide export system permease protein